MRQITLILIILLVSCLSNKGQKETDSQKISNDKPLISDAIELFIEKNIKTTSFINLSFCLPELIKIIEVDEHIKGALNERVNNNIKDNGESFDFKLTKYSLWFFINTITSHYSTGAKPSFIESFSIDSCDLIIGPELIISEIRKYENADAAEHWELSNKYFDLLIINPILFLNAIEKDESAINIFENWLNKIERYEFVAYGSTHLPPEIINRKREYILNNLKEIDSNLAKLAFVKISEAKIREIN